MRNWRVELGDDYWYDNNPDCFSLRSDSIDTIEKQYNCKFVTEWNLKSKEGKWLDPVLIFWNDTAHPRGSNWMGLYKKGEAWYVCDGITASQNPINCMVSNSKQVLFSKYRHDFRSSHDKSVTVDGGREYTRVLGAIRNESVWLVPHQGKLKIIPNAMALLMQEKNK